MLYNGMTPLQPITEPSESSLAQAAQSVHSFCHTVSVHAVTAQACTYLGYTLASFNSIQFNLHLVPLGPTGANSLSISKKWSQN